MSDSPATGRHRRRRRRRLVGPVAAALSVVLVTAAPVSWVLMHGDALTVLDRPASMSDNKHSNDSGRGTPGSADTSADQPGTTAKRSPMRIVIPTKHGADPSPPGSIRASATRPAETPVVPLAVTPAFPVRTTRAPRITANLPPVPPSSTPADQQAELLALVNAARDRAGCGSLSIDGAIDRAAQDHASDMVDLQYFSHDTPDGRTVQDRMTAAGWSGSSYGENIATGYDTAKEAFDGWMRSDGHRANILNCSFTETGIGYDPGGIQNYGPGTWVQDFGRP